MRTRFLCLLFLLLPPHAVAFAQEGLHVGVIRLQVDNPLATKQSQLVDRLNGLLGNAGAGLDVVLTPEYSLTSTTPSEYQAYAVDISCDASFDHCTVASGGGTYSESVLATIDQLRDLAMQNGFTLFLGTVIERLDTTPIPEITDPYVYFNDLLIIDKQGLMSIRRKTSQDWQATCCTQEIGALALATVRSFTINGRQTGAVESLPIICGERFYAPMIAAATAQGLHDLDILIGPEREGDTPYQDITQAIQLGSWSTSLFGWDWGIQDGYIATYVGTGLVRPEAFLVVAEGASGTAGLINLNSPPTVLATYVLQDEYMYGIVPIRRTAVVPTSWGLLKSRYR